MIIVWAALLVPLGLLAGLIAFVRLGAPTDERQAAIATLKQPNGPVRGRDGSDALWLINYEVPESEQAAIAAELRRYLANLDELSQANRLDAAEVLEDPRDRLRKFPEIDRSTRWLCREREGNCLATVRRDPAGAAAGLAAHAEAVAAARRLASFDGTRHGLVESYSQEMPSWGSQRRLVGTYFGLMFVQGRKIEALEATCQDLSGWRRHGADTDMLVGNMIAAAYVTQDLMLLAEMVAELPKDADLPAACAHALAPTRLEELSLCQSARAEFAGSEHLLVHQLTAGQKRTARLIAGLAVDADHSLAVVAPAFAEYCGPRMLAAARADRPAASVSPAQPVCGRLERVGDPLGCHLAELSGSTSLPTYQDRRIDQAARLALMRTILWVRKNGIGIQADFDRRPASLGLRRKAEVAPDGNSVAIPLIETRRGPVFSLPLRAPSGSRD